MKRRFLIFFLPVLASMVWSCHKDPPVIVPERSMKNLIIPQGFNYDSGSDVPLRVILPVTTDHSRIGRLIEIWDANNDGYPGKQIRTVMAGKDGKFESEIHLPGPSKKLFVRSYAGWRGVTLLSEDIGNPNIIDYNSGYEHRSPHANQGILNPSLDAVKSINPKLTLKGRNTLKNPEFADNEILPQAAWWSKMSVDSAWHAIEGAVEFGTFRSEGGRTFARIDHNTFLTGGFTQLIDATEGQVVTFSGDARGFDSQQDIYLFLIPRNVDGDTIRTVSCNLANPGIDWTHAAVTATMPAGTTSCQVMFYSGATGKVDFSNAFAFADNPALDADGDGVIDSEDAYPGDPGKAFEDYYPAPDHPATLIFEDSWPDLSDFDYNDLVVDYRIKRILNGAGKVTELDFISQVRAVGTTENCGFGFQFQFPPERVLGVSNEYPLDKAGFKLSDNGTEADQSRATFILFNEARKTFTQTQEGAPTINTTMGYYFVVPYEYIVRISLRDPIQWEETDIDRFNPFLFKSADRSWELHLPGHPPTDLASLALFGTGDDGSNPSAGRYYVSTNGLPWAFNLPVMFDYPIEGTDILKGYLNLDQWINGQTKYANWYLDKAGYRNWDFIYRW